MSNPALIARLGIDDAAFKAGMVASSQNVKKLGDDAKATAAQMILLQRDMNGNGTAAQVAQYKQLTEQLRGVQAEARSAARLLNTVGESGHGGGNRQELGHSARSITDMMLAGQSPLQAAAMEAPRIIQGMGGGVGTMVGVGAGLAVTNKVVEGLTEAISKSRELELALNQALKPLTTDAHFAGADAIKAKIEELQKVSEEARPAQSERFWTGIGQVGSQLWQASADTFQNTATKIGDIFSGKFKKAFTQDNFWTQDQRFSEATEADSARQKLASDLAGKQKELNELGAKGFEQGEESVRQAKAELELKEKLGAILRDPAFAGNRDARHQAMANAREEFAQEEQAAMRRQHGDERAVELEAEIVKIKREGLDVENKIAEARLKASQKTLNAPDAPKSGLQHGRNQEAADAAALALRETKEKTSEKTAEIAEAERLAGMDAPDPAKRRMQLESHGQLLAAQLDPKSDTYVHDDLARKGIGRDQAENEAQIRALDRDDKDREFARRREQIDAEVRNGMRGAQRARPGSGASLDAIDDKLSVNAEEQAYNQPGAGNRGFTDPAVASRLTAEATELLRQKKGIQEAEAKTLKDAKEHTTEMGLQVTGQTSVAAQAQIRSSYEDKITAALKDQNTELAGQLQKQQALALLDQAIDKAVESPEQRAAAAKKENDRNVARKQILSTEARRKQNLADNASMDPIGKAQGKYDYKPAFPDLPELPEKGYAAEAPENKHSPSFAEAFGGAPPPIVLPDRMPDLNASHASAGASDKPVFSDTNICSKLDGVITAIGNIGLTNR